MKTAVVTGASSGVGQAAAVMLARQGWNVAAVARRADALRQTVAQAGDAGGRILAIPCDVSSESDVASMARQVLERFGAVDALVNSAGTNTKERSWANLSIDTFRRVMEINLTGAYLCIQAFLPSMRQRGEGTVVNIVSDAAIQASPKAGAAYATSKFAMRGMTQSLNAEERPNGIRACAIYPGDIDTPLLENRPVPPSAEARQRMLRPEDVAECVLMAINLPGRAVIEELLIRPS